tara:strand:- start:287 stop:466 length:180 start_codon:yes stop_codon:yes gene_type:complete
MVAPYNRPIQTNNGIKTMSNRRKAAKRKAEFKSLALHVIAVAAFGLWVVGAQLMLQGAL